MIDIMWKEIYPSVQQCVISESMASEVRLNLICKRKSHQVSPTLSVGDSDKGMIKRVSVA